MKNQKQNEQQAKYNEEKGNQLIDEYNDKLSNVHMPYFLNREVLSLIYFMFQNPQFYRRLMKFLDLCFDYAKDNDNVLKFIDAIQNSKLSDFYTPDEIDELFKIHK